MKWTPTPIICCEHSALDQTERASTSRHDDCARLPRKSSDHFGSALDPDQPG